MTAYSQNRLLGFLSRALFPSWRFFEQIGHVPRLLYRTSSIESKSSAHSIDEQPEEFGAWQTVWSTPRRRWWNLVFNPQGNLFLAAQNALEQAMQEFADLAADLAADETSQTVSIENRVCYDLLLRSVRANVDLSPSQSFQFKVVLISQPLNVAEDFMISLVHEAGPT